MSDRTERPGAREGRRGLQSVVQLYLSRPPKRPFEWPEVESEAEADVAREHDLESERPGRSAAAPTAATTTFPPTAAAGSADAVAERVREQLDARIEAVSAIPFVDMDEEDPFGEDAGAEEPYAEAPHVEVLEAVSFVEDMGIEDDEQVFESAPEPVLSGISLDIEEPDTFSEILPPRGSPLSDRDGADLLGADEEDLFPEDALPPQEIGAEALRAELAFKLEEHLGALDESFDPANGDPQLDPHGDPPIEMDIIFEEDARAPAEANPSAGAIEEIFDLVERSLSLGPAPASAPDPVPALAPIIVTGAPAIPCVPSIPAVAAVQEVVAWDLLPEEETTATEIAAVPVGKDTTLVTPRVALFLSTLPPRLRRRLLDTLGAKLVAGGRRVLFLEPDPADDPSEDFIGQALGLDTAAWRRSLGASPREILLMRPEKRAQLFGGLAEEERRAELVLFGVGLPESIFCPRMLPLVDTVVVGLTRQESSLYEAYRALRGLPERRPGLSPYAVTIASSPEEAALLLERFRQIAKDFLRMPVLDGGWLELAALPQGSPDADAAEAVGIRDASRPGIAPELLALLASGRGAAAEGNGPDESSDGRPERPFFERLAVWFGPASPRP